MLLPLLMNLGFAGGGSGGGPAGPPAHVIQYRDSRRRVVLWPLLGVGAFELVKYFALILALLLFVPQAAAQTIMSTNPTGTELGTVTRNIPSGTQPVSGPLTDAQLRATAVPVDTELPTAAAAGDATANPTAPIVQGFLSGWNGTGWDRLRSSIANGLVVDVSRVQGNVAVTGTFWQATQPISAASLPLPTGAATETTLGTRLADATYTGRTPAGASPADNESNTNTALSRIGAFNFVFDGTTWDRWTGGVSQIGSNWSMNVAQINGVTPLMGAGNTGTGSHRTTEATDSQLSAGVGATGDAAATVGSTGSINAKLRLITSQLDALQTELNQKTEPTNTQTVGAVPVTSGGTSISRTVSAASTNATNVKASAGQVYQIIASNVNAAARYIHLYNTSGTPTCNTSIASTFIIPGNTAGGGTNIPLAPGAAFGTGIGFCVTTAVDGTGAVAANEIVLNVFYK